MDYAKYRDELGKIFGSDEGVNHVISILEKIKKFTTLSIGDRHELFSEVIYFKGELGYFAAKCETKVKELEGALYSKTQADRFVAYVNLQGGFKSGDMPPVMDLEWDKASANAADRWSNYSPSEIVRRALVFLNRVEQLTGRIPMMYTARSWWRERGIPDSEIGKFVRYPIWVADYSKASLRSEDPASPGNARESLWQFADSAKIQQYPNGLDANIFKGTEREFLSIFFQK
jgi:hypothetical protein